jgi:hypothetical protein
MAKSMCDKMVCPVALLGNIPGALAACRDCAQILARRVAKLEGKIAAWDEGEYEAVVWLMKEAQRIAKRDAK